MRQSSQKISVKDIHTSRMPPVERFLEESTALMSPETRFFEAVLSDHGEKGLVAIGLGKGFLERAEIARTDVERFTAVYELDPKATKRKVYYGIIPLKKDGHAWESIQSSAVRRIYRKKADMLFNRMEACNFSGGKFNSEVIELSNVKDETRDYLEFSSAAAAADRRPRKRKGNNSGDCVYFREFYMEGERAIVFGVFDGLTNRHNTDDISASVVLTIFKNITSHLRVAGSEEEIFSLFRTFLQAADHYLSIHMTPEDGVSFSVGLVYRGNLYYLNLGDSRIYGASAGNDASISRLTIDDGMAGLVDRGATVSVEEFFKQLKAPELYAGAFSQNVDGRDGKMVMLSEVKIGKPNLGKVSLGRYGMLLACTDGIWSNLPITANNGFVADASNKVALREILLSSGAKDVRSIVNGVFDRARRNMALKRVVKSGSQVMKSNPQDMAVLGFSI